MSLITGPFNKMQSKTHYLYNLGEVFQSPYLPRIQLLCITSTFMGFKESGQMAGTESGYSTMSYTWGYRKQTRSGCVKIQDPSCAWGGGLRNILSCDWHVRTSTWTKEPSDLRKDRGLQRFLHKRQRAKQNVNKTKLPRSWKWIK